MAENKKQHYVPKVYLRLFVSDNRINIFNIESKMLYSKIPYEDQFQKNYFYGSDLIVENILGNYETTFKLLFDKMISNSPLTNVNAKTLFHFLLLQKHRVDENSETIHEIVRRKTELECKVQNPDISDEHIKTHMSPYWEKHQQEFRQNGYKSTVDIIKVITETVPLDEYEIAILHNTSCLDFISSDNPVCMINPYQNRIIETGDLEKSTVFMFSLGYRKLVVVYKTSQFKVTKKKLNYQDVRLVNSLFAINATQLLLVPSSLSKRQIQHWLSTVHSSRPDLTLKKILSDEKNALVEISPKYQEYTGKIKFLRLLEQFV